MENYRKYPFPALSQLSAVLEEGGPMAFLRGSVPRLMHKIPANGCFFVFYEFFQRVLRVE